MTKYKSMEDKPKIVYFYTKSQSWKRMKLDSNGAFHWETAKLMEAFYEMSLIISKTNCTRLERQFFISCLVSAATITLGAESQKNYQKLRCMGPQ
jgi:hypothetical protein